MTAITEIAPEVRELAGKTAAELRRRGWIQRSYFEGYRKDNPDCAVCLVGAINAAAGLELSASTFINPTASALVNTFARIVAEVPADEDGYDGHLIGWNDERESVDEVLAVLDSIANG